MKTNSVMTWPVIPAVRLRKQSYFTVREDIDLTKPIYEQVHPLSTEAAFTVSRAMKVMSALTRQGVDTVMVDGEEIDLWDVKRDLRGLLGPDDE